MIYTQVMGLCSSLGTIVVALEQRVIVYRYSHDAYQLHLRSDSRTSLIKKKNQKP
jgi:hypothetical protein